MTFIKS